MQLKSEVNTSYSTWREEFVKKLEANGTGRHGFQNCFYGKLLIETFEQKHPELLHLIKVDEQFIKLIHKYTDELRKAYAYEWDKAKAEVSDNKIIVDFINELHTFSLLSGETKKIVPIVQESNQAFSFNKDKINFTSTKGTHVSLTSDGPFKKWFDEQPSKIPLQINETYQAYKVSNDILSINQGSGEPGIQIKRIDDQFLVCNNAVADRYDPKITGVELRTKRNQNLIEALTALNKYLQLSPKEAQLFHYEKDKITSSETATQVNLVADDSFKKWFDSFPLKKSQQLNVTYQAYKVNSNIIAINQGPNTPGIRIVKSGEGFQVVNNLTANLNPSKAAKVENLITTLDGLTLALQTLCHQVKDEVKNDKQRENCLIQ